MEQLLEVYRRPCDRRRPVVCMDEQPLQLIAESRLPLAMVPGRAQGIDYEYVREGSCTVWMFVEALGCWPDVRTTARRTAVDWAEQVRQLVDQPRFAEAETITLVCDNLNTHDYGSLYEAFPPEEALRLARKLQLVLTPKHGSWLNMAEPELSVMRRQSFGDRIASLERVASRAKAWAEDRNERQTGIDWQFRTEDARIKLKRLYPQIKM